MTDGEKPVVVCAANPALPDSISALCSRCSAVTYGTRGTVVKARIEGLEIICVDCFFKLNTRVEGVMHHGKMLTQEQTQRFVEDWLRRN